MLFIDMDTQSIVDHFLKEIRAAMVHSGDDCRSVAKGLGISEQSAGRLLNGSVALKLPTLLSLCYHVDVKAGETLSAAEGRAMVAIRDRRVL